MEIVFLWISNSSVTMPRNYCTRGEGERREELCCVLTHRVEECGSLVPCQDTGALEGALSMCTLWHRMEHCHFWEARILYMFQATHPCFPFGPLLMCPGRNWIMAVVLGLLPPTWETWMEFVGAGFSPAQHELLWLCGTSGWKKSVSLSLYVCVSPSLCISREVKINTHI